MFERFSFAQSRKTAGDVLWGTDGGQGRFSLGDPVSLMFAYFVGTFLTKTRVTLIHNKYS